MIIGCLGKGGSGKSTISTLLAKYFLTEEKRVLAVDADHNMDLLFNLTGSTDLPTYIGNGLKDIVATSGLQPGTKYTEVFLQNLHPVFSFAEDVDDFSRVYAHQIEKNLHIMASGPHTEVVLNGVACSHILSTPLKVYLPFLSLQDNEYVIVDEKAGSDGAGTGICSGFDVAVIAAEPTQHGIKAAEQIAALLDTYGTPWVLVGNKIFDEKDVQFLQEHALKEPIAYFAADPAMRNSELTTDSASAISSIYTELQQLNQNDRLQRSFAKFERNEAYK